MKRSWTPFLALLVALLLPVVGLAAGAVVQVEPGASLQEVVDSVLDGTTLELGPGKWEGGIVIRRSLTSKSAGAEKTVIEGSGEGIPVI